MLDAAVLENIVWVMVYGLLFRRCAVGMAEKKIEFDSSTCFKISVQLSVQAVRGPNFDPICGLKMKF